MRKRKEAFARFQTRLLMYDLQLQRISFFGVVFVQYRNPKNSVHQSIQERKRNLVCFISKQGPQLKSNHNAQLLNPYHLNQ